MKDTRDGKALATQEMARTVLLILQWDETFDIGADTGTPVDDRDYQVPFKLTAKLDKLTIKADGPKLTHGGCLSRSKQRRHQRSL